MNIPGQREGKYQITPSNASQKKDFIGDSEVLTFRQNEVKEDSPVPNLDLAPEKPSIELDTPQASKETKREMLERFPRTDGIRERLHGSTIIIDDFENVELTKVELEDKVYYKYRGPKSTYLEMLIEDLDQYAKKALPCWERLKAWNKSIDEEFDKYNCCNEHMGPITVSKDTLFLLIACLTITIYISVKLQDANSSSDATLDLLIQYAPVMVFTFTFYGMMFLSLPPGWAFKLFIYQVSIPLFLILYDLNILFPRNYYPGVNITNIFIRASTLGYALIWGAIYPCYRGLRKNISRLASHCFLIGLFIVTIFIFEVIYLIVKSNMSPLEYIFLHSYFLIGIAAVLSSFSWIYFHYKYFQVPSAQLESYIIRTARKYLRQPDIKIDSKDDFFNHKLIKRIMLNIYFVASMLVGAIYMGSEMFLASGMVKSLQQDSTDGIIIFGIVMLGGPAFFYFGLPIATNLNFSPKNKMLVVPILIIVPIIGCIPLAKTLEDDNVASDFAIYLITGPPVALIFWLMMIMVYLYRRRIFYLLIAFTCVFFWVPIYILKVAQVADVFEGTSSVFSALIYFFIITGSSIAGAYFTWNLAKLIYRITLAKIAKMKLLLSMYKLQQLKVKLKQLRKKRHEELNIKSDEIEEDGVDGILEQDINNIVSERLHTMAPVGGTIAMIKEVDPDIKISDYRTPRQHVTPEERIILDQIKFIAKRISYQEKEQEVTTEKKNKIKSKFQTKITDLIYHNLRNFGYWINATSFCVSYTFIIYVYFNLTSAATANEKGILGALTIVVPVIFVLMNVVIRMKSAATPPNDSDEHIYDLRFVNERRDQDPKYIKAITKVEVITLIMGVIIIPLLQTPLFFVLEGSGAKKANLFIMIVSILFSIIVGVVLEVKKRAGPFHKFFVPVIVSICWLFFILPYLVMFPIISAVIPGETENYELFIKVLVASSAFCFILLNSSVAIILNIILQKVEQEKLIKYVIQHLKNILKKNGVKGLDLPLRRLYDSYVRLGEETITNMLIRDRKPCLIVKIPETKRTYSYSHMLWLFETYAKALRKKAKLNDDDEKKKPGCIEKMLQCCMKADEDDDADMIDGPKKSDLPPGMLDGEDDRFKVDNYMPKELGTYWDFINGDNKSQPPVTQEAKKVNFNLNYKDIMTPLLEMVPHKEPTNREIDYQTAKEHCKMMLRDQELMEEWYQYAYDYFAGRTSVKMLYNREKGLVFINFHHFLRISCLSLKIPRESYERMFINKTMHLDALEEKIRYVAYDEFIELLHQIAIEIFPNMSGEKRLRKFTKKIYTPIMQSMPEIASYYEEHKRRHARTYMVYPPRLYIFNTEAPNEDISAVSINSDRDKFGMEKAIMPYKGGVDRRNVSLFQDTNLDKSSNDVSQSLDANNKSTSIMVKKTPSIELKQPQKKRKSALRRKLGACLASFAKKNEKCLKKLMIIPTKCGDWIDAGVKRLGQNLGFDVEDLDEIEEKDETVAKLEAPPWPVVVEIIMKNIPEAEKIYHEREKNKGLKLMCNITNIMAIYGKFMEIYGYTSAAFMPEIPWFSDLSINLSISSYLNIFNGEGNSSNFRRNFWIAISMVIGYIFFGVQAIKALRKGNLGEDDNGNPAKFPNRQYFVVLGVQILGGSFFSSIMKWIVDAFVCNYDANPWVLARDTTVSCLSDDHFMYLIIGVLSMLIYYPMCTFMFPNFQFKNKMLDLKYNPSWIVILIQIKLLLACIRSFFRASTPENVLIKLIATVVVLFVLALANLYIKPCLVKKFNVIDVGAYILAAYINLISIFVYETSNNTLGGIFLLLGCFAIVAITIYIVKLLYGKKIVRVKHTKTGGIKIEFDDSKRNAENPDLEKSRKAVKQKDRAEKLQNIAANANNITTDNSHMKIDLTKIPESERPDSAFYF